MEYAAQVLGVLDVPQGDENDELEGVDQRPDRVERLAER